MDNWIFWSFTRKHVFRNKIIEVLKSHMYFSGLKPTIWAFYIRHGYLQLINLRTRYTLGKIRGWKVERYYTLTYLGVGRLQTIIGDFQTNLVNIVTQQWLLQYCKYPWAMMTTSNYVNLLLKINLSLLIKRFCFFILTKEQLLYNFKEKFKQKTAGFELIRILITLSLT